MSVKTPNFMTTKEYTFQGRGKYGVQTLTLPEKSFVKPIYFGYLPKHVVDESKAKGFNDKTEVYCYTYFGILALPKDLLRQT